MRTLVLGLGNTLLRDDGVAIEVIRKLRQRLGTVADIEFAISALSGLALIDEIVGYDRVIVLDAIPCGDGPVGQLREIKKAELQKAPAAVSPHYTGIASVIRLGRKLGVPMPKEVRVYGITVQDPFSVGEGLSPELARAVPAIVDQVMGVLGVKA